MRIGPLNISWKSELREGYHMRSDLGKFVSCLTGGYSEENMIKLFTAIPEVFAPVDTIATAVQSADWQLRKLKDDSIVYDNKDWNALYNRPNWQQDWDKFIYSAVVYKYVTGNRYFYSYVPSALTVKLANVVNLWCLPSQWVEPKIKTERTNYLQATDGNAIVEYYDYTPGRDNMKITPEYISHDAFISVKCEMGEEFILKGVSPLRACEYPMSNLMQVYEARNVIYVKRGALGFIVSKKSDASGMVSLSKTEKQDVIDEFQSTYGLKRSKSPIAITNHPLDFVKTAMSISELEPFTETDASSDAIYAALRVPRELKPRSEGATYENQKAAARRLYTHVAIPEAMQIAALLSKMLKLADLGYYLYPCFDHVEDLQENKKEKAEVDWRNNETNRVRFLHGIVSLNTWIAECGGEPVAGNKLYDKKIFEMDEAEMANVLSVIKNNGGNAQNNQNNGNTQN